ncbi:MAG: cyanophycinase [Ferruginibacter sp.]|nr:cyanophycinase [Ferruginibacter sp.]
MKFLVYFLFQLIGFAAFSQSTAVSTPKGTLFIIGGGTRSEQLLKNMLALSKLKPTDHVVVLPMSSAEPDSSFYYFERDLKPLCSNTIAYLNFTNKGVTDKRWLDSVRNARLIFITGGDQNRFMKVVLHTPLHTAIMQAYQAGATIAGTSAGAAVMSKKMITGQEHSGDSVITGSFKKIHYDMVELKEGLGLVDKAIVDQHFVARSRYNRLLSVLAENPTLTCFGIDEGTALVIKGTKLTVTGSSQVIRLTTAAQKNTAPRKNKLVHLSNIRLDIFTQGDQFLMR